MRYLALLSIFLALPISGCGSSSSYVAATTTWAAVEGIDELAEQQYELASCPLNPSSDDERARCREAVLRLDHLIRLGDRFIPLSRAVRATRDAASAAILALWAFDEDDSEDNARLTRERISCLVAALHVLIRGFDDLDVPLPVAAEQAITMLSSYAGVARTAVLGECRGWDRATSGGQTGQTPPPVRDAGLQTPAGSVPADGGVP